MKGHIVEDALAGPMSQEEKNRYCREAAIAMTAALVRVGRQFGCAPTRDAILEPMLALTAVAEVVAVLLAGNPEVDDARIDTIGAALAKEAVRRTRLMRMKLRVRH
jgi:hypothetical protein